MDIISDFINFILYAKRCYGCEIHFLPNELTECPGCKNLFCPSCWGEGEDGYCQNCSDTTEGSEEDENFYECTDCEQTFPESELTKCPECKNLYCDDCWEEGDGDHCEACSDEESEEEETNDLVECPNCRSMVDELDLFKCDDSYCGKTICIECQFKQPSGDMDKKYCCKRHWDNSYV